MIAATEVPADSPCSPLDATLAEQQRQQQDMAVAVLQNDDALLAAAGLGTGGGQHVAPKHDSNSSECQRLPARVQPAGNGCLQMAHADFIMYRYKTQPCNKVYTHDWAPCPFYHRHPAERARLRSPLTHPYTAVLCPEMDKLGKCPRGDACAMSHSVFEYALHPDRFRTKVCVNGDSCTRTVCFYAHNPQELRRVSSTAGSTQPKPPACSGAAAVPSSSGGEAAGLGAPPGAALFVESGTAAGGQYSRTKPPMLPVVRVPAGQGGGMHAAQQGPLSSNKSNSTTCGMSWFGSSPLAPATPSSGIGLEGACHAPPLAQGATQQQQQALMLRCQSQPQSVPFRTAQQGYGGSQQGQQHMQHVPEISLPPSGPGSVSAGPDVTMQQVQAQLTGLGVSAATAAIYAAPGSSRCAADAAAMMRPQPYTRNAGAQVLQHMGPLVACGGQRQPVQQQQPAGGAGLGFGGAMGAEQPADGSTPGLVVCSGSGGQVPARLGVHAMLGMQQQQQQGQGQQGQHQGRVIFIQQQPFQPMLQQQQLQQQLQYIVPLGAQAAEQLQQQLNNSRVLQQQQPQGMAVPASSLSYDRTSGGVSGITPASQFPPGIFYQQGYVTNAGAAGVAATDSSLQPALLQQPVFLQPQQQQQQHLMMVPAGAGGGVGGIAGQGVQAIQGMGMGGKPGALAMQCGPSGF